MKQIFTLITAFAVGISLQVSAQTQPVAENFNSSYPSGDCWKFNGTKLEPSLNKANTTQVLAFHGSTVGSILSPYIILPTDGTGTLSFDYLTTYSRTNADVQFKISLINDNGNATHVETFIPIASDVVGSGNNKDRAFITYTSPALPAGTYRVLIEYNSTSKSYGNEYVQLDNLKIAGFYDDAYGCNIAPNAVNDAFTSTSMAAPVTGNLLFNDNDPNTGELLSLVSLTQPTTGTVTFDNAGNFTFVPNATFSGGSFTFSYWITDNGRTPLADTATVTVTYPIAPRAVDDVFISSAAPTPFVGKLLINDVASNGITLTPYVVSAPASGDLVLKSDGSFVYTPVPGFSGGDIAFTYRVTDANYSPLFSNVATVTITYPAAAPTPLPIKLMSFQGVANNNKAQLKWLAADNETGNHFMVLKSTDGKTYTEIGKINTTKKVGQESYSFADPVDLEAIAYYKLKIVNNDHSVSYSNIVVLKNAVASNTGLSLLQNPVVATVGFTYTANHSTQTTVSIYNAAGLKVYHTIRSGLKGLNTETLAIGNTLSSGVYLLEVINGKERYTARVVKK